MTTTYVWRGSRFVDKRTGKPMRTHGDALARPYIASDLPAYASPLGDGVVEGRAARREHLKRNGMREVDSSEFKPRYVNPDFAKKAGKDLTVDDKRPPPGQAKRVEL